MALLSFSGVEIAGIAACVPKRKEKVSECICLDETEATKLSASTGIYERRISEADVTTSDLCFTAANKLLDDLQWDRSEVDALIFVTQTPDYILPATSPLLQDRLGLSVNCLTLDISLGCSGYVYGLSTIVSLLASGSIRKGLLLVGDTSSKLCSVTDKTTYPLFGDAGTATALVHNKSALPINMNLQSDGSGYKTIMVKDGGYRNAYSTTSLTANEYENNVVRNDLQLILDGMDVFSFGISKAPEIVKNLLAFNGETIADYDHYVFHQANMLMNEKIRKKLGLEASKVPYTLAEFGNTSCSTIPLTMVSKLRESLTSATQKFVLCGFGVGLSWGAVSVSVGPICVPELIEI